MELLLFAQENEAIIQQELGFVILLAIAALVAIVIRRIRIPYTVALVLVGLLLAFFPNPLPINVSSELILAILVPPLLFEATLQIRWKKLRENLGVVLMLAIGGTLLGTVIVGEIVTWVLDVPLLAAFAFGALISATDPVAVIAFFRSLGVSKRLAILVEGESLFNDGVAIVLFNLAIGLAVAGVDPAEQGMAGLASGIFEFVRVSFGGLGVGLLLGYIVSSVILKNVDDPLIETTTTVALAFGSYVVAEELHVSGILAVVAAGLMVGNIGSQNTSPSTQLTLENFWEFSAFVANSLVFLLIGLEIEITQLVPYVFPILVAVLAILLSRAIIVYGFTALHARFTSAVHAVPMPFRHVMYWGGLRGAISLALSLTLTGAVFGTAIATELRVMTFGVVLFTLLVQGTTIETLIKRQGLAEKPEQMLEQQARQARLYARRAGQQELRRLADDGILYRELWHAMDQVYEEEISDHKLALRDHLEAFPELEQEIFLQAREDVLKAERAAIGDALVRGFISERVHEELLKEADNRLAALALIMENRNIDDDEEAAEERNE